MMCVHEDVGGDACSKHHFRAAKHRVLDTLSEHPELKIKFKVAWRVVERCEGLGGDGGAAADRHSTMMQASEVVGGDACSNHHYRADKHRVLDTLLEHSKLRITCKIARRVMERCEC
jgi:hypothetical protein